MKIFGRDISNETLIIILGIVLLWRILKNNIILLFAICYLLWSENKFTNIMNYITLDPLHTVFGYNDLAENFDETGTIVSDVNEDKYDLRGELIDYHPPEYDVPRHMYSCCRR